MRKLWSYLIGAGLGIAAGMALVTLFAPVSGSELRHNVRQHYQQAVAAGRKAAADKRAELEKELAELAAPPLAE
jgi:gas vesicle protein